MSVNPIISFSFDEQVVRTVERNGEPWFVLTDVCRVLGLTNPAMVAKTLADDERSKFNLGVQLEAVIVSEGGLYTIILRSRDAMTPGTVAYRFRRWLTGEVLPSIRKTGRYDATGQRAAAQLVQSDRAARRREIPGLMDKLEREKHPEKRRVLHALLARACTAEEIEPPALDAIGEARPAPSDLVGPFFAALGALEAVGVQWNHSRNPDRLAVSLSEVGPLFKRHHQPVVVNTALRKALATSVSPRFVKNGAVNSELDRRTRSCWIFELST